mgnify:FL=1
MLLLLKANAPVRALCRACRRLFEPTEAELKAAAVKRGVIPTCAPCYRRMLAEAKLRDRGSRAV